MNAPLSPCTLVAGLVLIGSATSCNEEDDASKDPVPEHEVTLQLIRNATLKVGYAGKTLLVDPMLSPQGAMDPFAGKARNPTVELPVPAEEVMAGVDAVLVTHTHPDHFDAAAAALLPGSIPVFVQPADAAAMEQHGAPQVVTESVEYEGITVHRTGGKHGSGEILATAGEVSGYVLQAPGWPTLYIVGDSIWTGEVEAALSRFTPAIVVTNSGGAVLPGFESTPILMGAEDTLTLARAVSRAKVVAVHLEALDHLTVTRAELRRQADEAGISSARLLIPADGETLRL